MHITPARSPQTNTNGNMCTVTHTNKNKHISRACVVLDYIAEWDNQNTHQRLHANVFLFSSPFLNAQDSFIMRLYTRARWSVRIVWVITFSSSRRATVCAVWRACCSSCKRSSSSFRRWASAASACSRTALITARERGKKEEAKNMEIVASSCLLAAYGESESMYLWVWLL